jgi:hypothetical protein
MKLSIELQYDNSYACIDTNEYDGAPDAGPQLIGRGKTEEEARADFFEQRMEREADRDMKRAQSQMKVWDDILGKLFGAKS